MALPYPAPIPVKTRKRCQFSLPGKKYDCRAMGKYVLEDKQYCPVHYDTKWRYLNMENGQQHDWHRHVNRLTGVVDEYESCKRCMAVRPYDGLPVSTCRGKMAEITLR